MDRRTLIAGGSAAAAAALLFSRSAGAEAARVAVTRTPAEWRRQLGPTLPLLREAGTIVPEPAAQQRIDAELPLSRCGAL